MPTPSSNMQNAEREYNRRLELLRVSEVKFKARDTLLGYAKLFLLLSGVAVAFWLLTTRDFSIFWIFLPAFLFILLAFLHEGVIRALKRCQRAILFYERGLARIGNQWMGKGETGDRFADPSHPYARDLDLFGKGSLFELLCDARTQFGEETLAKWLLSPAPPREVFSRNDAITDLRCRLDLREDLATLGELVRSGVRPDSLVAWAEGQLLLHSTAARVASLILSLSWLASWSLGPFGTCDT